MSELDTTSNAPAVPAGDTLFSKADGVYYSYGPRVNIDDNDQSDVGPPAEGQEPQFYGVYLWRGETDRWGWVADLPSVEAVQEYLKAV